MPPYNFDAIGIGLMNVAPFVGAVLGFPVGGYLSDKSILWLSKKNGGIYEPEQRLWLALPTVILGPASILLFGLGLAYVWSNPLSVLPVCQVNVFQGVHWSCLAVGFGIFGFTLSSISGISLSYLMDCYQDVSISVSPFVVFFILPYANHAGNKIIGDALVGVIFMRNIISVIILFVITPWVNGMGMQNLHILAAVVAFFLYLIPVPLLIWGKKARIATAARYRKMAANQMGRRTA